jgi:hypothetical protein
MYTHMLVRFFFCTTPGSTLLLILVKLGFILYQGNQVFICIFKRYWVDWLGKDIVLLRVYVVPNFQLYSLVYD